LRLFVDAFVLSSGKTELKRKRQPSRGKQQRNWIRTHIRAYTKRLKDANRTHTLSAFALKFTSGGMQLREENSALDPNTCFGFQLFQLKAHTIFYISSRIWFPAQQTAYTKLNQNMSVFVPCGFYFIFAP
jgi:hypothetical protein